MKIIIKNTNVVFATKEVIDLTKEFIVDKEYFAYGMTTVGAELYISTSTNFNITKLVDISPYIGKKLLVKVPKFTSSAGTQPNFNSVVLTDEKKKFRVGKQMSMAESTPSSGGSETIEVNIPEGVKYMGITVFNATKAQEFGYKLSCVVG